MNVVSTSLMAVFSLLCLHTHAQGIDAHWYFGAKAGLDFTTGTVSADTTADMYAYEGCTARSTTDGELLFYTNGRTVYDANHLVMHNGTGLLGNPQSAQSSIIVPLPGTDSTFYIVTNDALVGGDGLQYV